MSAMHVSIQRDITDTTFRGPNVLYGKRYSESDREKEPRWEEIDRELKSDKPDRRVLMDFAEAIAKAWHPYSIERPSFLVPSEQELEIAERLSRALDRIKVTDHEIGEEIKRFREAAKVIADVVKETDAEALSHMFRKDYKVHLESMRPYSHNHPDWRFSATTTRIFAITKNANAYTSTILLIYLKFKNVNTQEMIGESAEAALVKRDWEITESEELSLPKSITDELRKTLQLCRAEYNKAHKIGTPPPVTQLERDVGAIFGISEKNVLSVPERETAARRLIRSSSKRKDSQDSEDDSE